MILLRTKQRTAILETNQGAQTNLFFSKHTTKLSTNLKKKTKKTNKSQKIKIIKNKKITSKTTI